jgi:hypothetical protein
MSQTFTTQATPAAADYIVVVSNEDDYHSSYHHFAEKVNRKLKSGYQLHGPPFNVNQTLCQAMIRPEGTQHSGETTMFFKHPEGDSLI